MAKRVKDDPNQPALIKQEIPKMPEGYYSGDKPNNNIRDFIEKHLADHPYDQENDNYNIKAFNKPIKTTKTSAVYSMHPYHLGKKPFDAIESYICHYTKEEDIILDPFCGSGSTSVAALINNRKSIAIDASPAATFITRYYATKSDPDDLQQRFEIMLTKVKEVSDYLYTTVCHQCKSKSEINYIIYSNEYECPRCLKHVTIYEACSTDPPSCPYCLKEGGVQESIHSSLKLTGFKPVAVNYTCGGSCSPKRIIRSITGNKSEINAFKKIDLSRIEEIEKQPIPYEYPHNYMMNVTSPDIPWGDEWRPSRNFRKISELFTYRNLWAIAALFDAAGNDDDLKAVITSGMFAVSRKAQHLDGGGGYIPGNWALPPMSKQRNVINSLRKVFNKTLEAKRYLFNKLKNNQICISTQSAVDLPQIPTSSIDYIFTDPPYGGAVQYGELNFLWEAWLNFNFSWLSSEIIVNQTRNKSEDVWAELMQMCMKECYRVLKSGRWLSLCYHDTSEGTWSLIQDIMAEAGFIVENSDNALYIDTGGNTYNQRVADKVTKRDLVINFRKPNFNESFSEIQFSGKEDDRTFIEKVHAIIRDYLSSNPGSTKDRIYDDVVSRLVRTGTMEAHNFEELLRQVADEVREPIKKNLFDNKDPNLFGTHEISRWYLKETELEITDSAESAKEDEAADVIGNFIEKYLKKHKGYEGAHYSDLFEQYIYTIKDKPRRQLSDWLLDYFYKTDEGTYRLPASEEEKKLKAEGRSKGTLRRVRRYIAFLEQGVAIPEHERPNDATLAEWIRHCKRSGLYAQGKLLYEKGGINIDSLPEELMVGVEEDYQVCARMLSREGDKKAKKSH